VARLKPPHWRALPPAGRIGALARTDRDVAREAAYIAARLIAADLEPLGIDVDCAPVLDVPAPGSHGIIGDRAFCDEPYVVADLGKSFCRGLLEGGVLPVIKHIPGHGRATVDSHAALPEVAVHRQTLEAVDFVPFRALNDMPFAMTAHVVYRAYERGTPATTSAKVIADVIRGRIRSIVPGPGGVDLGAVVCLADDITEADSANYPDTVDPAENDVFFYLVRPVTGGVPGDYTVSSDGRVGIPSSGGCSCPTGTPCWRPPAAATRCASGASTRAASTCCSPTS